MGTLWSGSRIGGRWRISTLLPAVSHTVRAGTGTIKSRRDIHGLVSSTRHTLHRRATGKTLPTIFARSVSVSGALPLKAAPKLMMRLGQTKHVVHDKPGNAETRFISPLQPTAGADWKSMKSRMAMAED